MTKQIQRAKFGQVARRVKHIFDPRENSNEVYVGLEHIEQATGRLLDKGNSKNTQSLKTRFKKGQVLFGKLRPYLKKVARPDFDGVCSTEILVFDGVKDKLENSYLYQLCQLDDFIHHCMAGSEGTKMPRASWKAIQKYELILFPLEHQQKIAAILSSLDDATEKTQAVIDQLQIVKRGLMQQLFTRGVPGWHESFQEDEYLGRLPRSWTVASLGDFIVDSQNGLYKPQSDYGAGTLIARIDNFSDGDTLSKQNFRRVKTDDKESEVFRLEYGDIVVNRVNSLSHLGKTAKTGELGETLVFESNMMRLRMDSSLALPQFVLILLCQKSVRQRLLRKAKLAIAQASINQKDVRGLLVAMPSIEEQKKIVSILESFAKHIESEQTKKAQLQTIKKGLMQGLLSPSGAFVGRL